MKDLTNNEILKANRLFKFKPGKMDLSEVLSFISMVRKNKVKVIIESGRMYGYSTYLLGIFAKKNNIKFISIDIEQYKSAVRFSKKILKNLNIEYKRFNSLKDYKKFLDIIKNNSTNNIGILIDGPKDCNALFLANLFLKYNKVKFVFIDNISKLNKFPSLCLKIFFKGFYPVNQIKFDNYTFYKNQINFKNTVIQNDGIFIKNRNLKISFIASFICIFYKFLIDIIN